MIKIYAWGECTPEEIFARENPIMRVEDAVSEIIAEVIKNKDSALLSYTEKFDKVRLEALEVSEQEMQDAYDNADKEFVAILEESAKNIREFHSRQVRDGFRIEREDGAIVGQKVTPLDRVGLYVPGGTAAYPSTVLMDSIPAKIAGCKEIVMVTPPRKDGTVNPDVLVSAKVAGVNRIFKVGGAQAIGALAYGTETIPKVDKIVGPGNAFVAEAKKQVFGKVDIDMIAGPSEILVIADGKNDAKIIAADLLSQAEHDKMASAVLITTDKDFAQAVSVELERQIPLLPRSEIARKSIDDNGKIIVAKTIEEAIEISNEIAPEHLELCVDDPFAYLDEIRHAGSIFLGRYCPEALGDYFAGPNHTLPTSGTAKFSSPLSVDDFVKKTQFTYYTKESLAKVADKISTFANREGLHAHAKSATVRFDKE